MQTTLVISRAIVNKKIIFDDTYDYNNLCNRVDVFKNILTKRCKAKKGQTVMNGLRGYDATALFLATCELGMITVVASVTSSSKRIYYRTKRKNIDAKTSLMLPINYIFTTESEFEEDDDSGKGSEAKFYVDISEKWITGNFIKSWTDDTPNNTFDATPDSVIMMCTSSGTTGTPKKIQHTHEFMYRLCKRNAEKFYGKIVTTRKFMHGSSFATFFLPTLMSDDVTNIYASSRNTRSLDDIDHVQFPYTDDIEKFLCESVNFTKLNVYTLAAIRPEWVQYVGWKVKDIISMYGMSETSGPVLINKASNFEFAPNKFYPVDDFYRLDIVDGHLTINDFQTSDKFRKWGAAYFFDGRDDLIRVNDVVVPVQEYQTYVGSNTLVIDSLYNKIYLAIWDQPIDVEKIQSKFHPYHHISKYEILTKAMFMSGIKIDIQALREYFRSGIMIS